LASTQRLTPRSVSRIESAVARTLPLAPKRRAAGALDTEEFFVTNVMVHVEREPESWFSPESTALVRHRQRVRKLRWFAGVVVVTSAVFTTLAFSSAAHRPLASASSANAPPPVASLEPPKVPATPSALPPPVERLSVKPTEPTPAPPRRRVRKAPRPAE
jgi:hypothetical protein